jgi:ActR/RegA family two-component response regulator
MVAARLSPSANMAASPGQVLFAFCRPEQRLITALQQVSVDVWTVSTSAEASHRLREARPACLVLDVDAPAAGDIDLQAEAMQDVRVTLLASAASFFSAMQCVASRRADHVLMKPAGAEELLSILAPSSAALAAPRLPSLERIQWEYIHAVLGSCDGNVSEAARQLGIYRQSLQRMLRRHPPSR